MELLFVRSDVKWLFRGCKSAGNIDNIIDVSYRKIRTILIDLYDTSIYKISYKY